MSAFGRAGLMSGTGSMMRHFVPGQAHARLSSQDLTGTGAILQLEVTP
jgi:hypothetical protein